MNKQVKNLMSKLRQMGFINQLEELNEAALSRDDNFIKEEIKNSLQLLNKNC